FIQISALTLSLMVFAAMGLRLAVSLRKQDAVIRESQQQLIQSEKMASLGQMVAGLVHEMNTPLGFVRSNIEITERNHGILSDAISEYESMSTTLEQGDLSHLESQLQSVKERSEKIRKFNLIDKTRTLLSQSLVGLDRIQELILNLKNFSRLDEASLKPADINEGLDSALVIAQNMLKARATVEKRYAAHLVAECHAAQLNQVFLNLIMNAAQAITPAPGETGGTDAERQGRIVITTIAEPQWATIKISDNGSGIRPEHLRRIFEPFFTTKRVGEGTGLGLSIAYKIIEQHGGTIDVKSDVGMGTTFTVRIPLRHLQTPQQNARLSKMIQNNSQTSITTPSL
ncbi:MAG: hypothetical protein IAF08_13550, partial [Rhizobacter sp.]|nr:hypothetical protein [Chlorobiales bacterium]